MLTDIIDESLIQLKVTAVSREDAVRKAALPLLKGNKITANYTEAIISALEEYGPYFVLAPHIAMPHARTEEGAIENALGITVLDEPIAFNSSSNDPVKYIFTLSALDSAQHLENLASLATLFDDKDFFTLLDETENVNEIIDYLKNKNLGGNIDV